MPTGEDATEDRAVFALAQLAFWLLAATDGHAKNFSIRQRRGGRLSLTPPYGVLWAWPIVGDGPNRIACPRARLAMAIRAEKDAHYRLRDIQPRHWRRLAATCGPGVWERMKAMVEGVDGALGAVATAQPTGFPVRIWEPISAGMRRRARLFQRSAKADAGA